MDGRSASYESICPIDTYYFFYVTCCGEAYVCEWRGTPDWHDHISLQGHALSLRDCPYLHEGQVPVLDGLSIPPSCKTIGDRRLLKNVR